MHTDNFEMQHTTYNACFWTEGGNQRTPEYNDKY